MKSFYWSLEKKNMVEWTITNRLQLERHLPLRQSEEATSVCRITNTWWWLSLGSSSMSAAARYRDNIPSEGWLRIWNVDNLTGNYELTVKTPFESWSSGPLPVLWGCDRGSHVIFIASYLKHDQIPSTHILKWHKFLKRNHELSTMNLFSFCAIADQIEDCV